MNENHSPPLPGVRRAIEDGADRVHLTQDALAGGLTAELARRLGVAAERVVAGAGSGALIQQFLNAHAGSGARVVHSWPSFELYPLLIGNAGGTPVAVPGEPQDLRALAAAVTSETRVVLLCNPNNPTGEVLGHAEVAEFVDLLPPDVLVLIDEAYREFASPGELADGLALAATDDRVAVVRTFSKSHGLLGLRVGYLVASEPVAAALRPTLPFFRVGTLAQAAALAALDAEARMREQCAEVATERDRVRAGLLDLGWDVPPSGGNFLWLRLGPQNQSFVDHLAAAGVAVREIAGAGVRVSTGTPEANDLVLALAKEFAA
ncbi:aminotransferase class I/II-fold pyridoxal phosphate-dependent enzyme [Amycolatopsis sp. YIM 10]|uniref:aminotransferase class I/II-fold pyridoxal phosphate-dependent enzyme n=1 Tax=Amycolatopsis sp. YIM 10 TaxID=2653857 RepID=UPI001D13EF8C|nr:aminotransferase class I/II-fold pyridoxal phosphate-dependent enzyme [Amycolatopsis sp. YIM 10]